MTAHSELQELRSGEKDDKTAMSANTKKYDEAFCLRFKPVAYQLCYIRYLWHLWCTTRTNSLRVVQGSRCWERTEVVWCATVLECWWRYRILDVLVQDLQDWAWRHSCRSRIQPKRGKSCTALRLCVFFIAASCWKASFPHGHNKKSHSFLSGISRL